MDLRDCYRILDVDPDAPADELRAAYRRLARRWHPDRFELSDETSRERARKTMSLVNRAYRRIQALAADRGTTVTEAGLVARAAAARFEDEARSVVVRLRRSTSAADPTGQRADRALHVGARPARRLVVVRPLGRLDDDALRRHLRNPGLRSPGPRFRIGSNRRPVLVLVAGQIHHRERLESLLARYGRATARRAGLPEVVVLDATAWILLPGGRRPGRWLQDLRA